MGLEINLFYLYVFLCLRARDEKLLLEKYIRGVIFIAHEALTIFIPLGMSVQI